MAGDSTAVANDRASEVAVAATPEGNDMETRHEHEEKGADGAPAGAVEPQYPMGKKFAIIMAGLCLSVLCIALDTNIIVTAVPRITDDFHALQDVGWYGSAYLLPTCALQLLYGKIYSLYDIKFTYLCALGLFEAGSLICALAPNSPTFIGGRAVAGAGAAGIFSGVLLIIANSCPLRERAQYTGMAAAMYGISSFAGPLLGGVFTTEVTWRWCFWINLPLGAITAIVIIIFLHLPRYQDSKRKETTLSQQLWTMDPIGTILFIPSIVCLILALQWGGTTYAWNSGRIIALFVVFALLLIAFIAVQLWMKEDATVPPRIARQRTIALSSIFSVFLGAAFFQLIYFIPIWFQAVLGDDAWHSGIHSIPLMLSMTFGVLLSGGLTTKLGYYMPFVFLCSILISIGSGLISTFSPTGTSVGRWVGYQIIFGFGTGLAFQVPQIAAQAVLPLRDIPIGVSITFFAETLGGAIFVPVGDSVLTNRLIANLAALKLPGVDPAAVVELGATQFRSIIPAASLGLAVDAYNDALVQVFRVVLVMACLTILGGAGMEWRSVHNPVEKEKDPEETVSQASGSAEDAKSFNLEVEDSHDLDRPRS